MAADHDWTVWLGVAGSLASLTALGYIWGIFGDDGKKQHPAFAGLPKTGRIPLAGVVEDLGLEFRFERDDAGDWLNAYLPSGARIGKIMYGACRGEAWNAFKWRSDILDAAVEPEYRGMGIYPTMLSVLRDEVRQDKRCAGLRSSGIFREPIATASWEKFAEREPRVSRRGGDFYLDGLPKTGRIPLDTAKRALKKLPKKSQKCAGMTAASLREGMEIEREHRDVTHGTVGKTAKIAAAHICERPDYYKRIKKFVE